MTAHQQQEGTLDSIALDTGGFAMVAMDQRESLRAMYDAAGAGRPADDVLIDFKRSVARVLGPAASGFLIDRHYAFNEIRADRSLPDGTGLILAADALSLGKRRLASVCLGTGSRRCHLVAAF